jgi:hypothetical protein
VAPPRSPAYVGRKGGRKPHTSRGVCVLYPIGLRIQVKGLSLQWNVGVE